MPCVCGLGSPGARIDPEWTLTTSDGPIAAKRIIVATGYNHTPWIPWSGFAGELLHSSVYRNPAPYRGRAVLVVGTGNSGAEIAADLVEGGAGRVRVSVRTPPNILRREVGGISSQRLGVMLRRLPPALCDPVNSLVARLPVGKLEEDGIESPAAAGAAAGAASPGAAWRGVRWGGRARGGNGGEARPPAAGGGGVGGGGEMPYFSR